MTRRADVRHVSMREGAIAGKPWRQYALIADGRVIIMHLRPALLEGWNVERIEAQGEAEWSDMRADSIRAFKSECDDGLTRWLDGIELARVLTLAEWKDALVR